MGHPNHEAGADCSGFCVFGAASVNVLQSMGCSSSCLREAFFLDL
jgi:hypothetical protein